MNDSDRDSPDRANDTNIVRLPSLTERQAMQRREANAALPPARQSATHPSMFNIPPATATLLGLILVLQFVLFFFVTGETRFDLYQHFGFVPASYTGRIPFTWPAAVAPFSYMLLHGNWTHVLMNGLMLLAFGSGVERWLGPWRMLAFFILCGLAAAAAQLALTPFSTDPVIGASGGLSGLFAAVMVMSNHMRDRAGLDRTRLWPLALFWIVMTIGSGVIGMPAAEGNAIAWAAHLGGFLAGFAVLKLMRKF
jgi:membrane associated rhomboid family serine protease